MYNTLTRERVKSFLIYSKKRVSFFPSGSHKLNFLLWKHVNFDNSLSVKQ